MEVYKYHSNITQKWHGASRNYRYVLDVSVNYSGDGTELYWEYDEERSRYYVHYPDDQ